MKGVVHPIFPVVLAAGILLAAMPQSQASRQLSSPRFAPGSGIAMKITNFFEDLPPRGYLPLRVEVKNDSPATREWEFQAMHAMGDLRSLTSVTSLVVPAQSERTFDLLLPLAQQPFHAARTSNLTIVVSGYAVVSGTTSEHSSGGSGTPTPYLGMGRALALKYWTVLRDSYRREKSKELAGTQLDPPLLPEDWRGWACFDAVVFSEQEWRGLEAASRSALFDWVAQGGRLGLFHEGDLRPPDLPGSGSFGAGRIEAVALAGEATPAKIAAFLNASEQTSQARLAGDYTWDWKAAEAVGQSTPPQAFLLVFVLLFAVVIGPVNFLVLAPPGSRHRLFWTTPLLSVAASLLMGAGIIFSEGFGGEGQRIGLMWVQPGERRAVLWQEQVSRTGVLVSSRFTTSQPCFLSPIDLRLPSSNPFSMRTRSAYGFAARGEGVWSGDWFRSRTTQAQVLVAAQPTRERVEIETSGSGAPIVTSSFASPLERFWYRDVEGNIWSTPELGPGQTRELVAAQEQDFKVWREERLALAGPILKARADALIDSATQGSFFADFPGRDAIATLGSIQWTLSSGILVGQTQ